MNKRVVLIVGAAALLIFLLARRTLWQRAPADEREVVATVPDTGPEVGAAPERAVGAPWEGYGQMTAREVITRVRKASPEEAAAIHLYESAHKKRRTVLDAASKRTETAGG